MTASAEPGTAPRPGPTGRARALTAAFVVGLLLTAVVNLYVVVRDDSGLLYVDAPRSVYGLARTSKSKAIAGKLLIYSYLRTKIRGATLVIPPKLQVHRWNLERVARLTVEESPTPLVIDHHRFDGRGIGHRSERTLWLTTKAIGEEQAIMFVFEPGAARYVVGEVEARGGPRLVVLPEPLYRTLAVVDGDAASAPSFRPR